MRLNNRPTYFTNLYTDWRQWHTTKLDKSKHRKIISTAHGLTAGWTNICLRGKKTRVASQQILFGFVAINNYQQLICTSHRQMHQSQPHHHRSPMSSSGLYTSLANELKTWQPTNAGRTSRLQTNTSITLVSETENFGNLGCKATEILPPRYSKNHLYTRKVKT